MQRRVKGAALRAALRPFTTTRQLVQDVAPIFGVDLSYALQARMKRNDALKVLLDAHLVGTPPFGAGSQIFKFSIHIFCCLASQLVRPPLVLHAI